MSTLFQDLRFALRQLVRSPGFTATALLTLALGIGATTAVFSVVNAVVLRPLPYPEPDRFVNLGWQWGGEGDPTGALTTTKFAYFREHSEAFTGVATYQGLTPDVETERGAVEAVGMRASQDFFHVLGWEMAAGRPFTAEEDSPGGPLVAIIGHRLWQEGYGGQPDIVGRTVRVNGEAREIVGVAHPELRLAHTTTRQDVFLPRRLVHDPGDLGHNTVAVARVRPGWDAARVQADLDRVLVSFRATHPQQAGDAERGVRPLGFAQLHLGDTPRNLWILLGAVGFVLLIGCVNLANLLLARAAERRREIAVRAAVGAGRARIVRQLVTESFALALIGGVLGVLVAHALIGVLVGLAPAGIPRIAEVNVDQRVLLFALGAAVVTGIFFGVADALPATRGSLETPLREGSGGQSAGRRQGLARNVLVVGEVALTMVLLAGAGLLTATFLLLRSVDTGYEAANVAVVDFPRTPAGYEGPAAWWSFQQEALERLRALPGVEEAGTISTVPFQGQYNIPISIAGHPELTEPAAQWRAISPGYLEAMRARVVRGRAFQETDAPQGPYVAVVNEAFAAHYFPGADPLGERVQVAMMGGEPVHPSLETREAEIVGVVGDMRELGLEGAVSRTVYVPQAQVGAGMSFAPSFVLRTAGRVEIERAVAAAFQAVDPRLPQPRLRPLDELVGASVAGQRFNAALVAAFAALALLLTAVGVYGVLSYSVRQRTREVAIRLALGARAQVVVRSIVRRGVALVVIGLLIGIAGALFLTRLIAGLLYGVEPADPRTLGAVALLLLAIGALAAWLPARRAARVDPMIALRAE
jgi:putative ABC transport system permease protein